MGIDLLEHILAQLEEPVSVSYHVDPNIPTHLDSIRAERVDFGIAATTITSERLGSFEFSHPFYLADLGIIAEKEPTPDLLSQNFSQNFYQKLPFGWGLFLYFPIRQETSYLVSFWSSST
ncbi:MAG: transporter substrate-binding domain-containing protein [Methanosarcinales archaeon]|nr:transporter substrate-binding domain-containing protein [Methanosarcinales archaeon]